MVISELKAGTRYFYTVLLDGQPAPARPWPAFTTAPADGAHGKMRFAFGSCVGKEPWLDAATWADLDARTSVDLMLLLGGDRHFTAAYHVRGRFIEVTSGPLGSPGAKSKPGPEMFAYHDDGKFFCIYEIDTAAEPPAVTLEMWQTGTGLVEKRAFTWEQVTGGAKIEPHLPPAKSNATSKP